MTGLAEPVRAGSGQSRGDVGGGIVIKLRADDSDSALTVLPRACLQVPTPRLRAHRSEHEAF